jgi:hypothetical protein
VNQPGRERRDVKRRHLFYYLRVFECGKPEPLGYLADITEDGMMLMSERALPIDRPYRLRMVLPEGASDQEIEFAADARWCRKDVNPQFWDVGFRITDMPEAERETINWLIEDYGFKD